MTTKKENNSLEDFTWGSNEEFFGIENEDRPTEVEAIKKEVFTEEDEDDDEKEEDTKNEDGEEEDKEELKDKKKTLKKEPKEKVEFFKEDETVETVATNLDFKTLKENGTLQFISDEDLTEETSIEDILEKEFDGRLEVAIEEFAGDLDEEAKMFLKFKKAGGSTIEYLKTFEIDSFLDDVKEDDIKEDENTQIKFLKKYYENYEEMDDEEITDKIEWLKERGKIEETANKYFDKFDKVRQNQRADLIKKQKKAEEDAKEKSRLYKEDLKKTINETTEVGKIKLSKNDKTDLYDYLIKPSVKMKNGYITPFQKDMQEVYNDKKLLLALAKIVKNKFDIDIETAATTKATKEIKKNLRAGSRETSKKTLFDYF